MTRNEPSPAAVLWRGALRLAEAKIGTGYPRIQRFIAAWILCLAAIMPAIILGSIFDTRVGIHRMTTPQLIGFGLFWVLFFGTIVRHGRKTGPK